MWSSSVRLFTNAATQLSIRNDRGAGGGMKQSLIQENKENAIYSGKSMFKNLKVLSTLHEIVFQYYMHIFQKDFPEPLLQRWICLPTSMPASISYVSWIVFLQLPKASQIGKPQSLCLLYHQSCFPAESIALIKRDGTCYFFLDIVPLIIVQVWGLEMELTCFFTVWCLISLKFFYSSLRVTHTKVHTVIHLYFYAHGVLCESFGHPWYPSYLWIASMDIHSQETAHRFSQCC